MPAYVKSDDDELIIEKSGAQWIKDIGDGLCLKVYSKV